MNLKEKIILRKLILESMAASLGTFSKITTPISNSFYNNYDEIGVNKQLDMNQNLKSIINQSIIKNKLKRKKIDESLL